jgi:hypothetical protein
MSVDAAPSEFRAAFDAASETERHDFLAYLFIIGSADGSLDGVTLSPQTEAALEDFARRVKLDAGAPVDGKKRQVVEHFKKHPLNANLLRAYASVARDLALEDGVRPASAQALLAVGAAQPTGVLDTGKRPANTVPGGPLARLAALTGKFDKPR